LSRTEPRPELAADRARPAPVRPAPQHSTAERGRPTPSELLAEVERLRRDLAAAETEIARLAALADEDPLSGLLNRRGFDRELARASAHAARHGTPITLLLIDLDDFKRVNDEHGHAEGDRVIAAVGASLRAAIRASDVPARIGGDEFAVILWEAGLASAGSVARRLAAALPAPASLGAGSVAGGPPAMALEAADKALYEAKAARRLRR
jgi:diguanylate cyclase (GGDEF)-like protein